MLQYIGNALQEIPREELTKHIEEHCPFGEIKCPFRNMGCFVSVSHILRTKSSYFLDRLWSSLAGAIIDYRNSISLYNTIVVGHEASPTIWLLGLLYYCASAVGLIKPSSGMKRAEIKFSAVACGRKLPSNNLHILEITSIQQGRTFKNLHIYGSV